MLNSDFDEKKQFQKTLFKPSWIITVAILLLVVIVVLVPILKGDDPTFMRTEVVPEYDVPVEECTSPCVSTLLESIPENLTYVDGSPSHASIFESWSRLISLAERSIDIAAFYFTLRGVDIPTGSPEPSSWQGEKIFEELMEAGIARGITIRIVQSQPSKYMPANDTEELEKKGAAKVRNLDFVKLMGAGVLHTKMFLVDRKHFYVGSANMDWRSLTQVKELGLAVYNCSCLGDDIYKIFEVYWELAVPDPVIPSPWPVDVQTAINKDDPISVVLNTTKVQTYISSSPPPICPNGRTSDIDSILDTISRAKKFVYIAVMDYFPQSLYMRENNYWPVIDDALRKVVTTKGVQVRLLASYWNHTRPDMISFLSSLDALNSDVFDVQVKLFIVPTYTEAQAKIPFSRVNHNKYMVTDNTAYIGTSNWSKDYFVNTGGVGFLVRNIGNSTEESSNPIRYQLEEVFKRDWSSDYAYPIIKFREMLK